MMYNRGMDGFIAGFQNELCKLAKAPAYDPAKERKDLDRAVRKITRKSGKSPVSALRGESAPRQRDYLTSGVIAAGTFPAMALLSGKIGRGLRNKSTLKAMESLSKRKAKKLSKKLETGPLVAKNHLSRKPGQLTRDDLLTRAASGGVLGSLVMALRDRFAGSTSA